MHSRAIAPVIFGFLSLIAVSFFTVVPASVSAAIGFEPGPNSGDIIELPLLRNPDQVVVIDDTTLLVGDENKLYYLNTQTRAITLAATLPYPASDIAIKPGSNSALVIDVVPAFRRDDTGELRVVDLSTGTSTVIATGFIRPKGVAPELTDTTALVSDASGIWRVNLLSGTSTLLAPVSDAGDIVVESEGNSAIFSRLFSYEVRRIYFSDNSVATISTTVPSDGIAGPSSGSLTLAPDGSFALFTAGKLAGISKIDLSNGEVTRFFFVPPGSVSLGSYVMQDLAISPDSSQIIFSWLTPSGVSISKMLMDDRSISDITWGIIPHTLSLDPTGTSTILAIDSSLSGLLFRIDLHTGIPTLIGGGFVSPAQISPIPGTQEILIADSLFSSAGGDLWRMNLSDNTLTFIRDLPGTPNGLVAESGGSSALISMGDTISRVDLTTLSLIPIASGLDFPASLSLIDPKTLLIGSQGFTREVWKLDLATPSSSPVTLAAFQNSPRFVTAEPNQTHALVTEANTTLYRLNLTTGATTTLLTHPGINGNTIVESNGLTALTMTNTGLHRIRIKSSTTDPFPCLPETIPCASSIAFLPGLQASRLYMQGTFFENKLWEPNRNKDVEKLYLKEDGTPVNTDIYTRDVIGEAFGFNIYKKFIQFMDEEMVGKNVIKEWKVLPYDWRLDFDEILSSGKQIGMYQGKENISYLSATSSPYIFQELSRLASSSPTQKVSIITHSNGGLLAKYLLMQIENPSHPYHYLLGKIDKLIMVAAPQLGTPAAVAAMLHGDEQNIPLVLSRQTARELAEHMPSGYNLLPSETYFEQIQDPVIEFDPAVDTVTNFRSHYGNSINSHEELEQFLLGENGVRSEPAANNIDSPNVLRLGLLANSKYVHSLLDNWTPHEGIEVTQIAGWGIDTIRGIKYTTKVGCSFLLCGAPILYREPLTGDGDGTVVTPSSDITDGKNYYMDLRLHNRFFELRRDRKHADILEVDSIQELIREIIKFNEVNILPQHILRTKPNHPKESNLRISVHSPVSIDAYDSLGNHTGLIPHPNADSDLMIKEEQIPNSSYLVFGEGKYILLDSEDNYQIKLKGLDSGTFTFRIEETHGTTTTKKIEFADIPVSSTTVATLTLATSSLTTTTLNIDFEGDGKVDFILDPNTPLTAKATLAMIEKMVAQIELSKKTRHLVSKEIQQMYKLIEKKITRKQRKNLISG